MKAIKIDLPKELDCIEIEPLYDLHIGSEKCDYKEIERRIEKIRSNEHVYAVLGGDIINNSTINSVAAASVYTEQMTPMQQIIKACEMLKPISDKILGVVSGNHERRASKEGIDLTMMLCSELDCLDKYDPASIVLFIRFGVDVRGKDRKICYSVFATHGSGGGGMIGSKANKLSKTGQIIDTDLVIVGHTHSPLTFRESSFRCDYRNFKVVKYEQVFVNASATVDYEQYAELNGMKPSSKRCPTVIMYSNIKRIEVVS